LGIPAAHRVASLGVPEPTALFEPVEGDGWLPTAWAVGPWSPDALHGGPPAALLAREAERAGDEDAPEVAWHPARLTVELLRPVPVTPLRCSATVVRAGRRIQIVDSELATADGSVVSSARLLRIRTTDVEAPDTTAALPVPAFSNDAATAAELQLPSAGWDGFHNRGVEHRFVEGRFGDSGPATDWIRLTVPLVEGEDPSPLARVAAAADFGNGISSETDWATTLFINPDLTIHLRRVPSGEWVCLEAVTWMGGTGVALAESRLWDEGGLLGRSLQSLLVDRRS
jgi:hypothetical protein